MGGFGNVLFQINKGLLLGGDVYFVEYLTQHNIVTRALNWKIHQKSFRPVFPELRFRCGGLVNFCFDFACSRLGFNLALFGYFQDHSVSEDAPVLDYLRSWLSKYSQEDRFFDDYTVIHLRLTDANDYSALLDYYRKALQASQGDCLFVCTDDRESAHQLVSDFHFEKVSYSELSVLEDFRVLCSAPKVIFSKSTFSFWAFAVAPFRKSLIFDEEYFFGFMRADFVNKCRETLEND